MFCQSHSEFPVLCKFWKSDISQFIKGKTSRLHAYFFPKKKKKKKNNIVTLHTAAHERNKKSFQWQIHMSTTCISSFTKHRICPTPVETNFSTGHVFIKMVRVRGAAIFEVTLQAKRNSFQRMREVSELEAALKTSRSSGGACEVSSSGYLYSLKKAL